MRDRRATVARLLMQHHGPEDIARLTGYSPRTVDADVKVIREQWKEVAEEPRALAEQELASLGGLERYATTRLRQTRSSDWVRVILEIKGRRARLLGLDAPAKVTIDVERTLRELAAELGVEWRIVAKHLILTIAQLESERKALPPAAVTEAEVIEGEVLDSEEEQTC